MRLEQWNFSKHYLEIEVEGFKLNDFLSECMKKQIPLREVKYVSDLCLKMQIRKSDLHDVKCIGKNRYKVTVRKEEGYARKIDLIFASKTRALGMALFAFIIYFQSLFVSEIRIDGYERIPENEIRRCLAEAGLREGVKNDLDFEELRLHLYRNLENVVFVGIHAEGCLVLVDIVEGEKTKKVVADNTPCNIVAEQDGYIYKVISTEGIRVVEDGIYVNKGDILISGIVPLKSTAYGQPGSELTERYVHAGGSVVARIPERFTFFQSANKIIKEETGRYFYNIGFKLGDKKISLSDYYHPYEVSQVKNRSVIERNRPFPCQLFFEKISEVNLKSQEKNEDDIEKETNKYIRQKMKENLKENTQILNKSLYFTQEKNIIEVTVMLETLQEIGIEQEIVFGKQNDEHEETSN